jgi:predicted Zn-dependent protease
VALVATGVVTACETVPYTGRSQLQFISPRQESEMGARVGSRIAAVTGHPEYKWKYRLIQAVACLLGAGATVGVLLPWSRAQESEADHVGLILMAKAGYDPHVARDLWVRVATASQGPGKPPEFLSTHPPEPTRIRQIDVWMSEAMQYYRPC